MREIAQDLWTVDCNWICITTNAVTDKSGNAIMGRGCALEARKLIPNIDQRLGYHLRSRGNHVHELGTWQQKRIFSFPVKHHWRDLAHVGIIAQSCEELIEWVNGALDSGKTIPVIALPRPGCGAGGLSWQYEVKPVLEKYFYGTYIGDNIIVVSKPGEY